jgi:uncharacterized protein with GYD domain
MPTFVMLTRLVSEEVNPSFKIQQRERDVVEKVRKYLPKVTWVSDFAVLGPWDYLDIFTAPDLETAMQVSSLVRYYGGAHTEVWPAVSWKGFLATMQDLSRVMEKE